MGDASLVEWSPCLTTKVVGSIPDTFTILKVNNFRNEVQRTTGQLFDREVSKLIKKFDINRFDAA